MKLAHLTESKVSVGGRFRMKLSLLSERRGAVKPMRLFHGTSEKSLSGILSNGLTPKGPAWGKLDDPKAVFATPTIELALRYGKIVVEVSVNERTTQWVSDEEHFPLGEVPSLPEGFNMEDLPSSYRFNSYASLDEQWSHFWGKFDELFTPPNDAERDIFRSAYNKAFKETMVGVSRGKKEIIFDQWHPLISQVARKLMLRRSNKPKAGSTGFSGNMMYINGPIKFYGRNKIVGIYKFDKFKYRDFSKNFMVCEKTIYSNDGSISVGDAFMTRNDWCT